MGTVQDVLHFTKLLIIPIIHVILIVLLGIIMTVQSIFVAIVILLVNNVMENMHKTVLVAEQLEFIISGI